MSEDKINQYSTSDPDVTWSSEKTVKPVVERRSGVDRRKMTGRAITVPDRRSGADRRKIRLTITGRPLDIE